MNARYDAIVIGAGFSGLAAGIRLAQFERKVVILERHSLWGGLNSFYKHGGRRFDTGLHALTNYVPRETKNTPLPRLLRQLRLDRDALALGEQSYSEIAFPGALLRFSNDPRLLESEVARLFPASSARFAELLQLVRASNPFAGGVASSARARLTDVLREPLLVDMLLCAICYYGSAQEHDVEWDDFVVLFRSIFLEGFARPEGGVKRLLDLLVARYREAGGELRMRSGVRSVIVRDGVAQGVVLENGEELSAERVFSSAGAVETLALAGRTGRESDEGSARRMTFFETTWITDRPHGARGHAGTIRFFCETPTLRYAAPRGLVDLESGVLCASDNYASSALPSEGRLHVTVPANGELWCALPEERYREAKELVADAIAAVAARHVPDPRIGSIDRDAFTPRTIRHYTAHHLGSVYGSPHKRRDGRTEIDNLFLIGTDQGFVGIVGAMLSGISMANRHALVASQA